MKYRKKPVIIEAVRITEETFTADHPNRDHIIGLTYDPILRQVEIPTLEGTMIGSIGDWIITGVNGEHYPCKPDIFEKTYERVEEYDKHGMNVYEQAIAKWGQGAQIVMAIEELAELQVELAKLLNNRTPVGSIITEIADVEIMLEQLKTMHGIHSEVELETQRKLARLQARINQEAQNG